MISYKPLSCACSPDVLQLPVLPLSQYQPSVLDSRSLDLDLAPAASPEASGCSRPERPAYASGSRFSSPSPPWFSWAGAAPWPAARGLTAAWGNSPPRGPGEEVIKSRHTQECGRGCTAAASCVLWLDLGWGCSGADSGWSSAPAGGCWLDWLSAWLQPGYSHTLGCGWWCRLLFLPASGCRCCMGWLSGCSWVQDCAGCWGFVLGCGQGWASLCDPGLREALDRSQSSPAAAASECSSLCEPSAPPGAPELSGEAAENTIKIT